jgi:hypothetical protein
MTVSTTSRRDNVVEFKRPSSQSTEPVLNGSSFLGAGDQERLRSIVEGAVMDAYVKMQLGVPPQADSPFGPVFIDELVPDHIDREAAGMMMGVASVQDLSESIVFTDDLD